MVDTARQLLDELMGRNRNLDPTSAKVKKVHWDDAEFCLYYLVKFCPHDLFVNTRADLGQCPKLHDDEAKRLFEEARYSARKRYYEDEFLRFSNHMINEVDRKIEKGKQRLLLMNKTPEGAPPVFVSKYQEQLNNLDARIKKLIGEAEEAGNRGDVDQAQGLMTLCDQLKEEKEALIKNHENNEAKPSNPTNSESASPTNGSALGAEKQWTEYTSNEKQMEVCEVCGAFLIVGDAQQRIEDHLSGKQHLGYSKLRRAVEEMYEKRKNQREEEERMREEERKQKMENGMRDRERRDHDDRNRRRNDFDDRRRDRDRERDRRGDRDRFGPQRDRERDRDRRSERDRYSSTSQRDRDRDRERERDRDKERDREGSHRNKNDERSNGDRRDRRNRSHSRSHSKH